MRLPALFLIAMIAGCAPVRLMTIRANYPDAVIRVNNKDLGKGPIDFRFIFNSPGEIYEVRAILPGYKDGVETVTLNSEKTEVALYLKRETRRIYVQVDSAPAIIKLDGQALSEERVSSLSRDIELGLDERNVPVQRVLTAERPNFVTARRTISALDRDETYVLALEPMRKSLAITTTPPGAELYVDDHLVGTSPFTIRDLVFAVDLQKDAIIPRQLRVVKKGFDDINLTLGWDEGKTEYPITLPVRQKEVRLFVDPPGATVMIDDEVVPNDALGVTVRTLTFPPINDAGEMKSYRVSINKKTQTSEWEPRTFAIAWEDGRTDYRPVLKEVLTYPVPMLGLDFKKGTRGWEISPQTVATVGMKESTEPAGKPLPTAITHLARGAQIDSLALSPDGSRLVFTVLSQAGSDARSQMFLLSSDGSGAVQDLTDGKSLDVMPAFTPDGSGVVYSSNRLGGKMQIWSIPTSGPGRPSRLTNSDSHDLWPAIDSDPRPRLFRQAMVDGVDSPRTLVSRVGAAEYTELATGSQPHISLRNDSVLFCKVDDKTGLRDIYQVNDQGGDPVNLTNTPDVDEHDPAWSRDGRRILYSADRSIDEDGRRNFDIWMISVSDPLKPIQITANGSLDDSPVFDVLGTSVYFRSNRGGQWGIWKIPVR